MVCCGGSAMPRVCRLAGNIRHVTLCKQLPLRCLAAMRQHIQKLELLTMADAQAENQRPAKRAKGSAPPDALEALTVVQLQKHHIVLPAPVSPAAVFGCRVAGQVVSNEGHVEVFLASGSHVYQCNSVLEPGRKVDMGKEGVLLPRKAQDLTPSRLPGPSHQQEIQTVSLTHSTATATTWLGTVDSYGHAILRRLDSQTTATEPAGGNDSSMSQQANSYVLAPPEEVYEAGWAGMVVDSLPNTGGELTTATAAQFARQLCLYQGEVCVRTLHTLQSPTAVTLLPGDPASGPTAGLLACAEEHMVSLWDVRAGERGGLVQRLLVSPGGCPLFSLAWCEARGGLLGAAGAERAVTMLDTRKWRVAHKWSGATKYSVHHIAFSSAAPSWCYVSGLDHECVVGRWGGGGTSTGNANSMSGGHGRAVGPAAFINQRQGEEVDNEPKSVSLSFRSDSSWMGVCTATSYCHTSQRTDTLLAASQEGSLFLMQAHALAQGTLD